MDKAIRPGQFHTENNIMIVKPQATMPGNLEFGADSIAIYRAFKEQVYNPSSVLYPSCGFDASPIEAFGNVTFVDLEKGGNNEGCIETLRHRGLKALKQDIREYTPLEMHDLLILLNPSVPHEWATRHLVKGGWVIANNYHRTAWEINEDSNFELWGAINTEKKRKNVPVKVSISRDLTDLLVPVKDMKEFKELRPREFKLILGLTNSWINNEEITSLKTASIDEKCDAYLEMMRLRRPSKRVAERYIFVKK